MGIKLGYVAMDIDYASLACFWSRLTDEQKKLVIHEQFDYLSEDAPVKKESVLIVWSKLTKPQKKLINCGFFHNLAVDGRITKLQKEHLYYIQIKHEELADKKLIAQLVETKKRKKRKSNGTPAGPKVNWKISRLALHIGNSKCWYTGEECIITNSNTAWQATREHIISQVYGWSGKKRNTVIAAGFVNNLLGCAPLHVKMHVKNELGKIFCHPSLTWDQKKRFYKKFISNILEQYKVCGMFPWNNPKGVKTKKLSKRMSAKLSIVKMAYYRHMLIQKNYVDNIQANSNNIREYLEEKCDGMETGLKQAHGLG